MKRLEKYKFIFWDFDGVIMDSMPTRSLGFEKTLADFPKAQVDELLAFHNSNGGLSRYVKFRYFFEEIRKETISDQEVLELAQKFSDIMLSMLINEDLLIKESVSFIKQNYQNFIFHIVSGSDGNELRKICHELSLDQYFLTIEGSPTPKKQLVKDLLQKQQYFIEDCCLIGDSHNDAEAARFNTIDFFAYNNIELRDDYNYIESLSL
ncbi:HAD family hydrolase [Sphingobacterium multivorum]|uniref:HAD family hydrolase n=1 Tax=Sphingobacterium multivorum TaxID=28454 RepID=UPI0028A83D57|nr:HAD family hydrolase [Sphingobacterium multivorum]